MTTVQLRAATKFHSSAILLRSIHDATSDERLSLTKALDAGAKAALPPEEIQRRLCLEGGHGVGNMLRGEGDSYLNLLWNVAEATKATGLPRRHKKALNALTIGQLDCGIPSRPPFGPSEREMVVLVKQQVDELERRILAKVIETAYNKMTPEQRAIVDAEVRQLSSQFKGGGLGVMSTTAALLVVGNLGGFATFTLMSTILSTLSMGALSFGSYAVASSVLGVLLGPVGWIGLGAYGIYKMGGANMERVAQGVIGAALVRQRLKV